ncbi:MULTISPECIES: fumarylacetoacetate hydrolase family protein [unclassified Bacillus (in: firmicutes)]|uniref:fumarylacetoacetate hydrolase family protein n=1 Tax=unclassified Bacillus (in: firmicutes) TaxID=185979 RepID=UPI000BEFDE7A|nr:MULTISPECIES: fumarylacetoacetate hydrolase family protein [unclassified Bacillus (in: firmicutes)]PEJ60159.1 fumarylacetoacetase [Bacillus sp. AFS002410]PEL07580.1 fumarylacetoacetase [Bacillus sp. AFS017336]
MKFITFQYDGKERAGLLVEDQVIDLNQASNGRIPVDLLSILENYDLYKNEIAELTGEGIPLSSVQLRAPLPRPQSIRDFYAFEEHVKTARGRRGLEMIPEWYEVPVFYFTNHRAVVGPDDLVSIPANSKKMDFELEIACIIGKEGKDISVEEADDYILGYTILNDWSARDIQAHEVKVGLGPSKGKDFATSIGPWIVTKDELEQYRTDKSYDLRMTASVNGNVISSGNFSTIYYSIPELIAHASKNVKLYPGDVIGSGTVGTGCILELGEEKHRWLEDGDEVELSITGLGTLRNTVRK